MACAAALETIALLEDGLMENAARQGAFLLAELEKLKRKHPSIGDVRGKGLMIGFDLVGADGSPGPTTPRISCKPASTKACSFCDAAQSADSDLPAARRHSGTLRDGTGHHVRMPGRVGQRPGRPQQEHSDCLAAVAVAPPATAAGIDALVKVQRNAVPSKGRLRLELPAAEEQPFFRGGQP